MEAAIISAGRELPFKMEEEENAAYLSRKCLTCGCQTTMHVSISNRNQELGNVVKLAAAHYQLVIVEGNYFSGNRELTRKVHEIFADENEEDFGKNQILMENHEGMISGLLVPYRSAFVVFLPESHTEVKYLFEKYAESYLDPKLTRIYIRKIIKMCCQQEDREKNWILDRARLQPEIFVTVNTMPAQVSMEIKAFGKNREEIEQKIESFLGDIQKRYGDDIYADDDISLEECVVSLLKEHGYRFITAESCTGGMVASAVINVPGASDSIQESFITYSNQAKMKYLKVSCETLEKYTEYSRECAEEMAKGAAAEGGCQVAVSVTGLAGPGGGTQEKPVGLVYIGCFLLGKVTVREYHFQGNRELIRKRAQVCALDLVRRCILINDKEKNC